jgi:hypothetical protein
MKTVAAFDHFDAIRKLMDLSPKAVGSTLGANVAAKEEASNPYFAFYGATLDQGPYAEVEVRVPGPEATSKETMVVLTLRDDVAVSTDDITQRYPDAKIFQLTPEPFPEGRIVFSLELPKQKAFLSCTNASKRLVEIALTRAR